MDAVLRAAVVYLFLLLVFRIAGRRMLSETTTFDLVLLLIVAEATQQGLLGNDFSVTNAFLVIITLIGIEIALTTLKRRSARIEKWIDGVPSIIIEDGRPLKDRMEKARVDERDILAAARTGYGLERMDQIKYAVLERNGSISIIPKQSSG
ncbi:MAG: DUF421 domain-containing protein [Pseudomonadota bacterium]|nr:DUF421 domain-containing protein [Gammaproteobacteria bacterium]MDQ3580627.1 DUF421 domain-containing protein [Pseudomonadota bacterium]